MWLLPVNFDGWLADSNDCFDIVFLMLSVIVESGALVWPANFCSTTKPELMPHKVISGLHYFGEVVFWLNNYICGGVKEAVDMDCSHASITLNPRNFVV
jgi:hypothetical protein